MKVALFLNAIAGAAAFAPTNPSRSSSALNSAQLDELRGVGPESAGKPFDPLSLAELGSAEYLRKGELSNGRAAMLATVGWIFPKVVGTFTGPVDTVDPIEAIRQADSQWWGQFLVLCGAIEVYKMKSEGEGKSFTGEIGKEAFFDWSGNWSSMSAEEQEEIAMKELKNGRLAMIGIASFAANYFIPGSVPGLPAGF